MIDVIRRESCGVPLERICEYFGATKSGFYAHAKLREGVAGRRSGKKEAKSSQETSLILSAELLFCILRLFLICSQEKFLAGP